jgi:transposase
MANAMVGARNEGRTYRRVEVITGSRRRQNWTADQKARIITESLEPWANISEVARRNVSRGLLNVWRRQARELAVAPEAMFAAVRIESNADQSDGAVGTAIPTDKPPVTAASTIEVEIGDATIRVPLGVDVETLHAVITALRGAR